MANAPYYEIDYAGSVQRLWIVTLAACWSATPPPPAQSPPPPPPRDDVATARPQPDAPPARAPLDGRLQIQPADLCGGAAPPEDYVRAPLAPRGGVTLRVFRGDRYLATAPVLQVTTAADGTFTANLPAGRYCIARDHGVKPTTSPGPHTDLACLVSRWETCEAVVDVPLANRVDVNIFEPCDWSVCYHGPPPP